MSLLQPQRLFEAHDHAPSPPSPVGAAGGDGVNLLATTQQLLAVPDAFRQTALAFPAKIDLALVLVDTVEEAKDLMAKAAAMEHYAKRVKADTEIMNAIGYGKLKIVAKLGELMPPATPQERGAKGGRGNKAVPADRRAFDKNTETTYRKVAAHKDKIDTYYETVKDGHEELTQAGFIRHATGTEKAGRAAHVSLNTGIPEWYTPSEFLDAARCVLGGIDLDPASSDLAQENVKATRYYTLDDDGLSKPWHGRVWLNPPYDADRVGKFVGKLCAGYAAGEIAAAILLVNNATETKWFQAAAAVATAFCFPAGRIKFLDESGEPRGAPLQGQALLYFGTEPHTFISKFSAFGFCLARPSDDVGGLASRATQPNAGGSP